MKLTPRKIRQLVEITFAIEPLIDKKDCTTRFQDLADKPLIDFIISGVNVGEVFEDYAQSIIENKNKRLYSHYKKAVLISDQYKSKKYITAGLLEVIFIAIRARIRNKDLSKVLDSFIPLIKETTKQDLLDYKKAFEVSWSTSSKNKRERLKTFNDVIKITDNFYDHAILKMGLFPPDNSTHQVMKEYIEGFPTTRRFIEEIDEGKGLLKSISDTYNRLHKKNPLIKVGWLADLSAMAIFLYLSYQKESYVIH